MTAKITGSQDGTVGEKIHGIVKILNQYKSVEVN
jgi:hypothetical protein